MENIDWTYVLTHFVLPAIVAGVSLFATLLLNAAKAYVARQNKSELHWVAASIVVDAVQAVLPAFLAAISDGKLSDAEKADLKKRAREIAEPRLRELSGFAKGRLTKWLDDEIEIALGKLTSGLGLSPRPDTATLGPDTPASE